MRRYYFYSKKLDVYVYVDTSMKRVDSWVFYEQKEKRVYASPIHEKYHGYTCFEYHAEDTK